MKLHEIYIRRKSNIENASIGDPVRVVGSDDDDLVQVENILTHVVWPVHRRFWHNYQLCINRNPFNRIVRGTK